MWYKEGKAKLKEKIKELEKKNEDLHKQVIWMDKENEKLSSGNAKLLSENIELKFKMGNKHPVTGVDQELLAENTTLKDENRRLWEIVKSASLEAKKLERIALALEWALDRKIPSRGERKVIVVKRKER